VNTGQGIQGGHLVQPDVLNGHCGLVRQDSEQVDLLGRALGPLQVNHPQGEIPDPQRDDDPTLPNADLTALHGALERRLDLGIDEPVNLLVPLETADASNHRRIIARYLVAIQGKEILQNAGCVIQHAWPLRMTRQLNALPCREVGVHGLALLLQLILLAADFHLLQLGQVAQLQLEDGFRLSVVTARLSSSQATSTPRPVSEPLSIIVPAKALRELVRVAKDEKQPIRMCIPSGRAQVLFHLEGNTGAHEGILSIDLVSQLIEGNFVNYGQIVPKSHRTRLAVDTDAFLQAVKTANIFARNEAHVIRLDAQPGEGKLAISATSAEMGDTESELDAVVEGEPVEVKFNAEFLIEALSVMDTERVIIELSSNTRPAAFRPEKDEGFTHVIMPMTVRK